MGTMGSFKFCDIDLIPSDLEFAVFSSHEIKKISVVKIITGLTYDTLGHPLPGGLYDPLMGNYGDRFRDPCATCLSLHTCTGHMGYIELNALVFNPFFIKVVQKILSVFCLKCSKIQMEGYVIEIVKLQLQLIDAGFISEAQELEHFKSAVACQSSENVAELENGDVVHPRIAELHQLVKRNKTNVRSGGVTKTSCSVRTALLNSVLQRPTSLKCKHCHETLRSLRYAHRKLMYYITAAEMNSKTQSSDNTGQNKIIFADECRNMMREIYSNYPDLLKLLFPVLQLNATTSDSCPTDLFFMDTIAVTPPKARPANVVRDRIIEHAQTGIYRQIIENNGVLRVVLKHMKGEADLPAEANSIYKSSKGASAHEKLYNAWQDLQNSVDLLLDTSISRSASAMQGLKQVIEKKDGLIRKHMMGKRVNYAARTVITPDPNINVEEVGIPDIFARKLSYPVPVTPWNISELRKMVLNGPMVHPGANYIEDERGYTTLIPATDRTKRESMAKLLFNFPENGTKVVHRHMINGDVLLLNRQPSLHRASIMAHKARILQGEKTFRLHYSNCKAYNADFDGDEMNAHYPQSEVARAEAYNLVNVANNYLVPKDGTPLGGLIQDHVISGVKLSIRGRFFNREDYQQLVFQGLSHIRGNIKLLPPSILKPFRLWSGKQVLSTIIINLIPENCLPINLHSFAKIGIKHWVSRPPRMPMCGTVFDEVVMSESRVIIHRGELLSGVLDKQQYGATTFGLIHCIYELYGGNVSTNLLTAFTKVFTFFLQREGFTLGVKDILVTPEADARRREIIKECREAGSAAVAAALELNEVPPFDILAQKMEEAYIKDPKFRVVIDRKYKSLLDGYTNDINATCLPKGLISKFPANNLQLMVLSGAKGSMVNTMQISSLLGQIELEGKRPPLMISGKSLPSFASFETSPKSGGFIDGRFMTGIQPQDFFFHCMAGREGLIDTAVKTSRSGYLQRCLIKHLEGLTVSYDLTVRDSDSTVVQYLYGEDGLDVLKSKFILDKYGAIFLAHNAGVVLQNDELDSIKDSEIFSKATRHAKKIRSWKKKKDSSTKRHYSAFVHFSAELRDDVDVERPNEINPKTGRRRIDESILTVWKKADEGSKELYRKKYTRCPDPTASIYSQDRSYGSASELVEKLISDYRDVSSRRQTEFADIMYLKNMKSLVVPGEPVGLLAAQSIGEPSTQMTLNTFHFAGRGEMNVTLGIPRLREILMLASAKIKTPSMDIPILPNKEKAADKLRIKLNRVTLADILQTVNVKFKLVLKPECRYQYKLHFQFLPREAYKDDFCVKPKNVLKYVSETFFRILFRAIIRTRANRKTVIDFDDAKQGKAKGANAELDGDDDDDDDVPASNGSKKRKTTTGTEDIENVDESSDEERGDDDDDDATGIKLKARKQDETEYDDPEDVEEVKDVEEDEAEEEKQPDDLNEAEAGSEDELDETTEATEATVFNNEMVTNYVYDKQDHLWCQVTFNLNLKYKKPDMASIIRELANKCVIHEVHNIKRAIIYKNDKDEQLLKTDGINIGEICNHNKILDVNRVYCNDIHAIVKTYGIEAATQVVVKEVSNVFKVYGITISRRHLSLIADYMTFDGTFQPLSRKGMESSSSPLQQMSFETSMQFLKSAAGSGRADELNSPSSRLMVGLPVRHGTGAFDLLTSLANC